MDREQELMRDFMYYVKRKRQAEKRGDKSSAMYWYSLQLGADDKMKLLEKASPKT